VQSVASIWGLSKSEAKYGPAPTPEVRCDHCRYMFPKLSYGGCRLVRGVIRAGDSCREFQPAGPGRTQAES
jgi:hypothetical protein